MSILDRLRGDKTIVSEFRSYIVDGLGKQAVNRSAVSVKVSDFGKYEAKITQQKPHVLSVNTRNHLHIASSFPIRMVFIPGDGDAVEPVYPEVLYTTGVIYVNESIEVNSVLQIRVFDPDVVLDSMDVTLFNTNSGETEFVKLVRTGDGVFSGQIPVLLRTLRGLDFDGVMHSRPDDVLSIIYKDARTALGVPGTVAQKVLVTSSFTQPDLIVRTRLDAQGILGIYVENGTQTAIVKLTNLRTGITAQAPLTTKNDVDYQTAIALSTLLPIVDGDIVRVDYADVDLYGAPFLLSENVVITTANAPGVIRCAATAQINQDFAIELADPDVLTDYVDLILTGVQTKKYCRVRAARLGVATGIYRVTTKISTEFAADSQVRITYTDSVNGRPSLVTKDVTLYKATEEVPVVVPEETTPVLTPSVESFEMIGDLLVLNGSFSGIIKLYGTELEPTRCSILQS